MGADGLERDYLGKVRAAVAPEQALRRAAPDKRARVELLQNGAISTSDDFTSRNSNKRAP